MPVVSLLVSSLSTFFFRKSTTRFLPFLLVRVWFERLAVELWLIRGGLEEDDSELLDTLSS